MKNDSLTSTRRWLLRHHQKFLLLMVGTGFVYSMSVHGWAVYRLFISDVSGESAQITAKVPAKQEEVVALKMADFPLLFGSAKEKPRSANGSDLPNTSLNLTLRGALAPASAIIQGSDGRDRLYLVGDKIPGGSILESVHPQYVVIQHRGNLQRLSFPMLGNKKAIPDTSSAAGNKAYRLPNGPLAEAKELERKLDPIRQRANRNSSGQGN